MQCHKCIKVIQTDEGRPPFYEYPLCDRYGTRKNCGFGSEKEHWSGYELLDKSDVNLII